MAYDSSDIQKNKNIAALSYILFFIPMLSAKRSPFAMFHANQSLIILLISVAGSIVSGFIPFIGGLVGMVASIGALVLWIMGIINAVNGEAKPLPVIGGFKLLK